MHRNFSVVLEYSFEGNLGDGSVNRLVGKSIGGLTSGSAGGISDGSLDRLVDRSDGGIKSGTVAVLRDNSVVLRDNSEGGLRDDLVDRLR